MIINLCLLNYCFGNEAEYPNTLTSNSEKAANTTLNTSTKTATEINFAQTGNKLKVSHFPAPPAHTFVGNEMREMEEEQENIQTKGVVIE